MSSGSSLTVKVGYCRSVVRRELRESSPAFALFERFRGLAVTWVLGNPDHFTIAYSASLLMACSTVMCAG